MLIIICLKAVARTVQFFFYFQFSKMYAFRVSLLLFTYVVFPLIYLFNILQFVPMVDTTGGADFCDKNTVFVYINFLRSAILFSLVYFLLIYLLKHNHQFVLMVDTTAGAELCDGDTILSLSQLVMRTLLFSYLNFLRYDMFFVNQFGLFFYINFLKCVILLSLACFFIC